MDEHNWLVERFEVERPQLQAIAYRMLGSLPEAPGAVRESWLHLVRADRSSLKNLGAWLTRAVARIWLDMLSARKVQCEQSLEASLPESITRDPGGIDPEEEAELADLALVHSGARATVSLGAIPIPLLVKLPTLAGREQWRHSTPDCVSKRNDSF
jgi:DNA-directed RNA polymerase specialized sigma24 family protein